ncbi:MAG: nucleotidyltransferase family protein [Janthinobacterium lividum]
MTAQAAPLVGILLAAGQGRRFDPTGSQDKLLQHLPDGAIVALRSAQTLLHAIPSVLAVVRPGATVLANRLAALGCTVQVCPQADEGMGATLAFAISQCQHASGWVIALADMPHVRSTTIASLVAAIGAGADIAVPVCQARRGNPVAFSRKHLQALLCCHGDQGARQLLSTCPVVEVEVDDAGIGRDIDKAEDLHPGMSGKVLS